MFMPLTLMAQKELKEGYIIQNDNDTVFGYINMGSNIRNAQKCIFQINQESAPKVYLPFEIKAYKIEGEKYYISHSILIGKDSIDVFLEYLLDGIVDLFYYKDIEDEFFFIMKDNCLTILSNEEMVYYNDENRYIKYSNQYIRVLNALYYDCPEVAEKINNISFSHASLIDITEEYHQNTCKEYNCIEYSKSTKNKLQLEPQLGYKYSLFRIKTSDDFISRLSPVIGCNLRYTSAFIYYAWSISTGIHYNPDNFRQEYKTTLIDEQETNYRISMQYHVLQVPIIIQYTYQSKKVKPFFTIELHTNYFFKKEYEVQKLLYLNDDNEPRTDNYSINFREIQFGLSSAMGIELKATDNSYCLIKISFSYENFGYGQYLLDYLYTEALQLSVGYGFNIF